MATHDHGLATAPGLDVEALRSPSCNVGVEVGGTGFGRLAGHRFDAWSSQDSISSRVMFLRSSTGLRALSIRA